MAGRAETAGARPPVRRPVARTPLLERLGGAIRAARASGHGYEPQPLNPRASFDGGVDGYFVDLSAKTVRGLAPFVSGRGHAFGVTPTARAQLALGWWERRLEGDATAAERFVGEVDALLAHGQRAGDGLLWRYDAPVPKYGRRAPWYSAMAQGQAASALVRAWLETRDDRYADAATGAIRPLTDGDGRGTVVTLPEGPALEECPSDPPSLILNGWIYALWGLWDVARALGDARAAIRFDASAQTLAAVLARYDLGWWSLYSLFPARDLATPFYHRIHVVQLEVLGRLCRDPSMLDLSRRWAARYQPTNRARALAAKARAVLAPPAGRAP